MEMLIDRFCTSRERARILLGLNAYRKALFEEGFLLGEQWIDGSFVEQCERNRGRPPQDIDLLTLFHRPLRYQNDDARWKSDYKNVIHKQLFNPRSNKTAYLCDTYSLDLDGAASDMIKWSCYWFGLFSEQRETGARKGIIKVPLPTDKMEFIKLENELKARFNV